MERLDKEKQQLVEALEKAIRAYEIRGRLNAMDGESHLIKEARQTLNELK